MDFQNKLKKNISLKDLTTFWIGPKAKYFCQTNSREEVVEAIKWAKAKRMPFFVLGGGSNVLINDKKYKGLVIKIRESGIRNQESGIEVGAGVALGKLVGVALQEGLTGMEWAMGIPGTVGGAIYGNAGAFGQSISDCVEKVEAIDFENQELRIRNYEKEECDFNYRDSIFKRNKNLVILSAKIKLQTGNKIEIENKMKEYFQKKKQTQPLEFFSAGSVFRNQELGIKNQELLKQFLELKQFQDKNIIPSAWLIEKAGLKGKRIGGVEISRKHSNFIVNNGRGKARDVKKLIDLTKKTVKKKFGVDLEEEIQYLGF
ncbi:MAG: UDP-N-acetylmuramate dehydrogenase [bacterium]|nr:UDP-N-acetylmuramate dehydrogenase [bacterium]